MQPENKSYKKVGIIVGSLVVCAIALTAIFASKRTEDSLEVPNPSPVDLPMAGIYKDGTYSATGSYTSPAGNETIGVTVTLMNNIITDATVVSQAENQISQKLQGQFVSGYKEFVVGKNIDEVNVTKVSGSSLTSKGFNNAIEQIKEQAKS